MATSKIAHYPLEKYTQYSITVPAGSVEAFAALSISREKVTGITELRSSASYYNPAVATLYSDGSCIYLSCKQLSTASVDRTHVYYVHYFE